MSLYKAPSFQFYPRDFIADTTDLTNEEVGAYVRLICRQWMDGSLPSDVASLGRIAGGESPKSMARMWKILSRFFKPHKTVAGALVQGRLEEVRDAAEARRNAQIENGKRGGRPPGKKPKDNPKETQEEPSVNPTESSAVCDLLSANATSVACATPIEFAKWFLRSAVASDVLGEHLLLDVDAWAYKQLAEANTLFTAYGADLCQEKSLALFRAHKAGKIRRPISLAALEACWSWTELTPMVKVEEIPDNVRSIMDKFNRKAAGE